ncbi:hypothetical protein [Planococcus sp. ISL-109]|uniref:hypothetical protein n=1 Tax=Planococcus sp. ISL-109 TaxID=2819166 RepID=UPI001BE70B6D|nr:hypothetical protein [Planococcus sp. ISL-109]MBT2582637.1 hypothetical protein [Planococcus sp. ISL-109]
MLLLVALSAIIAPFIFVVMLRMSVLKGMSFSATVTLSSVQYNIAQQTGLGMNIVRSLRICFNVAVIELLF